MLNAKRSLRKAVDCMSSLTMREYESFSYYGKKRKETRP